MDSDTLSGVRLPVVMDDVAAACAQLTDEGRAIVRRSSDLIRSTVLRFAADRAWPVVSHCVFADWVVARAESPFQWIVLDPLLAPSRLSSGIPARVTRAASGDGYILSDCIGDAVSQLNRSRDVGIVDDNAVSGATLTYVAEQLERLGLRVRRILVASSGLEAREQIARRFAPMTTMLQGNFRAIHVRDLIPFLPHAGRRLAGMGPVSTHARPIERRVVPLPGSVWDEVRREPSVRRAVADAHGLLLDDFEKMLGRAPIVMDVARLGTHVPLPVRGAHIAVSEFSRLDACLGEPDDAVFPIRRGRNRSFVPTMVAKLANTLLPLTKRTGL